MTETTSPNWRYPYGSKARFHMHHAHLFCSDIEATIDFYTRWFDAEVAHDGPYANSRNVFMKIGIGAIHLYDQPPRDQGRNAVHHLGFQVVGIDDLYDRMKAAGVHLPNPIRRNDGSAYFMVAAPDNVLLEVFEPGPDRPQEVNDFYGFNDCRPPPDRRRIRPSRAPCALTAQGAFPVCTLSRFACAPAPRALSTPGASRT